jgi:pimeloyl-ACP methyl ester carboxylesterase
MESNFADVNGIRLHYLAAGRGDPVVLLHGFAQTSHMWRPLIAELSGRHTVIAPDLRGFGQSAAPADGYTKAAMAQDVHALLNSLKLDRVRLVGHDIGLMVAYALAAQYPQAVDRLVLMEAFLPGVGDWNSVFLLRDLWHFHFYGKTPLALVTGRERTYLEHFWNDFAADPQKSVSEEDREIYACLRAAGAHGRRNGGLPRLCQRRRRLCRLCQDEADHASAGSFGREGQRTILDRAGQDGGDEGRRRSRQRIGALVDGRSP